MKQILSFFAGICLVILTAAATGVTEFKPARPKSTVVLTHNYPEGVLVQKIMNHVRDGYMVKSIATSNYGTIVIMEKY
jgi:hypothetical protein